jgi:rhomboid protease GluP
MRSSRTATTALITVICAGYLLTMLSPSLEPELYLYSFAVQNGQWYRLFTVALVHGGLLHLGFNMFALHALGTPVEQAFGKVRFLIIFFFSLLTGSLASIYFAAPNQVSVGASGAVFGLFGAFAIVGRKMGIDVKNIYVIVGINFAIGFVLGGIDWHAHLGGLIGGAAISWVLLQASER